MFDFLHNLHNNTFWMHGLYVMSTWTTHVDKALVTTQCRKLLHYSF